MKSIKKIFGAFALMAAGMLSVACDDNIQSVLEDTEFSFSIIGMDNEGKSLFDPSTDVGRFFLEEITVTVDGVMYPVINVDQYLEGRDYDEPDVLPSPRLVLETLPYYEPTQQEDFYYLSLCGFDGARSYDEMKVNIIWPGTGEVNEIFYSRTYDASGKAPHVSEYIRKDDEFINERVVTCVIANPESLVSSRDPQ